ncbi:MAG: phosphonate metabolism transcriptional regulator PhnF [Rhodospirillaceae bacterium]|nr:phosphonate metabolism transcriptional regulator PhnF [Rhodospirillaceae bacterium]
MELSRGQGVSLWRQIEQILEGEIAERPPGTDIQLPTEQELVARFDVNRHTIRRALAGLQERGLIRIEQGRGSFVQDDIIDYALGRRVRFSENLSRQSRTPTRRLLRSLEVPADPAVAEALGIRRGEAVTVLETVGEADSERMCLSAHYFSSARFPGIAAHYQASASITDTLRHYGIEDYHRRITRITARLPTGEEARYLHQPRSRPVLVTEAVDAAPDGTAISYGLSRFASDRVQLVVEGSADSPGR